jgi:class 3 adenylate cyclase
MSLNDADLPSGTVTMLFTDIEGSTRLARSLGNRYQIVLADHHRVLREAWRDNGGQEISTEGDSFFVVFRRAHDAVAAAVQAQRALAAHRWPEGADLRVRMGMHTGEPEVGTEGYVGLGVHRAARIAAAAHGGQVLLSTATRHVTESDELDGVKLRDLGPQILKDFAEPQRLFQLEIEGLQSDFPPLKTIDAQEHGELPFVGQEAALADAARDAIETESRRRTRRRLAIGGASLLLAAAAAVAITLSLGGKGHPPPATVSGATSGSRRPPGHSSSGRTPTRLAVPLTGKAASRETSPAATLVIRFQPLHGIATRWVLTCGPPGGTHPIPAVACAELTHHPLSLLGRTVPCLSGGDRAGPRAEVVGRFRGKRVSKVFRPGCGARFFKLMHVFLAG